jgi:hypothetical protein
MPPPADSPFKRDEPVARSAMWIWLAFAGAVVWTTTSAFNMFRALEADIDAALQTLLQLALTGLEAVLAGLLFRSARTASACRRRRNFDVMAQALKAQRPFWTILTVTLAIGAFRLVFAAVEVRDTNGTMRRWLDRHAAAAAESPDNSRKP